jgi:hypothetical protein
MATLTNHLFIFNFYSMLAYVTIIYERRWISQHETLFNHRLCIIVFIEKLWLSLLSKNARRNLFKKKFRGEIFSRIKVRGVFHL